VSELRFEEIRALDAGAWFDQRFAGLRVPSLDEVLIWAGPRAVDLMLELKAACPGERRAAR
jgi:glycerophosphoryl diester phosphodiesterase